MKYSIQARYLTAPSKRRPGTPINRVLFIVAHDTGNANSTASQNVRYYENSRNDISASAHLFVDDTQIIECIPALTGPPEKAWHVRYNVTGDNERYGADANDAAIGVELCFSTNGSINNEEAYKRYVWVLAYICDKFGLNPATDIIGHGQLDPSRREDPLTALRLTGRNFNDLVRDVVREFQVSGNAAPGATAPVSNDGIGTAVILANALNVRRGPSISSSVVKVVNRGEAYIVYAEENGWYNVGGEQWISASPTYVRFTSNESPPQNTSSARVETAGVAEILADALNVRSGPSIASSVVKVVNKGEAYQVYTEENGWYNVGGDQWISASPTYVRFRSNDSTVQTSSADSGTIGAAEILADALNVRSGPSITAPVVKVVNKGEVYKVYAEINGWYNVGGDQWISASPTYVRFRS